MKVRVPGGETRLRHPRVRARPHRAGGPAAPGDGRVGGRGRALGQPRRPAHAARAAPTSSPRPSTAPGWPACSARWPATTRCCAWPRRASAAPGWPRSCGTWPAWPSPPEAHVTPSETRPASRRHGGDALARPLRRRAGRRADGLHRQPAVRPAAVARRHRRARRRTSAGWRGPGCSTDAERDAVLAALDAGRRRAGGGHVRVRRRRDEDIHTAVERRVTELAGPAGAKLHTGRSRNDQVATDLRLWCKRELPVGRRAHRRPAGGAARAGPRARAASTCPGYTHLQRAQPVLLAHHLLAHGWALGRDVDRLLATRRPPRRVAARRRRARRLVAAARPRGDGGRPRLRRRRSTTASTPSATATSSPRRCST